MGINQQDKVLVISKGGADLRWIKGAELQTRFTNGFEARLFFGNNTVLFLLLQFILDIEKIVKTHKSLLPAHEMFRVVVPDEWEKVVKPFLLAHPQVFICLIK
jgi:hypothetical protein